ncbi:hypothetical protein [Methylococcus sp. EFPC2]|uniref:hypothetical protein n=1 Tax=Methylococcus sp. EFPC2 TaxID=2812648 RepID=UPI001967D737|nr:hypothetical protein [Methylococcus sp. EFPC2]QSA98729.1 hypothetical protein JWZ97_08080 [Methylococcus sp. EFPC2]
MNFTPPRTGKHARGMHELAILLSRVLAVDPAASFQDAVAGLQHIRHPMLNGLGIHVRRRWIATQRDRRSWWDRAAASAHAAGKVPVVAYRLDREPDWTFIRPLTAGRLSFDETASLPSIRAFLTSLRHWPLGPLSANHTPGEDK